MPAETVLALATREGARALGIDDRVGTIEVGKRADLVHFRLDQPFNGVAGSVASKLVYTASRENVVDVWCDGRQLVQNRQLTRRDLSEIMAAAGEASRRVLGRL
jgi:5-methylthioadenosine/S-adenosylhomocysteine deaminase